MGRTANKELWLLVGAKQNLLEKCKRSRIRNS